MPYKFLHLYSHMMIIINTTWKDVGVHHTVFHCNYYMRLGCVSIVDQGRGMELLFPSLSYPLNNVGILCSYSDIGIIILNYIHGTFSIKIF